MPLPPMPTQVRCPKCQASFVVEVRTLIDVGEEPDLKQQFLRGRVNYAKCPQCGSGGMMSTSIIYHDPDKELLISYMPPELSLSADQRERYVGSLVNAVMDSLPPERRKGYFLQPRTALTLDSLFDAILEADGITKEMLEDQRAKVRLITMLREAAEDEGTLSKLVEEHRQELNYEFFLLLSNAIDADEEAGDQEHAEALRGLREKLLDRVSPAMPAAAPEDATYQDLIDMLQGVEPGRVWRTTIALNRARLDYGFFQALTSKIEAAEAADDTDTTKALTELRERILEEIEAQNRMARDAQDKASLLIMELSEAENLEAAVREHRDGLNDVFVSLLARYQEIARAQNDVARAEKLGTILETVIDVLDEDLSPELRLIHKLLMAEYPDGTDAVLEENRGLLNEAFLASYDQYVESVKDREDEKLLEHLKQTRSRIVAKVSILRA